MSAVVERLREARALIKRGWTRGEFQRGDRFCAVGAIAQVTDLRVRPYVLAKLRKAIGLPVPRTLVGWNDAQKSKKQVLSAFDKAIELAEAEQ